MVIVYLLLGLVCVEKLSNKVGVFEPVQKRLQYIFHVNHGWFSYNLILLKFKLFYLVIFITLTTFGGIKNYG